MNTTTDMDIFNTVNDLNAPAKKQDEQTAGGEPETVDRGGGGGASGSCVIA